VSAELAAVFAGRRALVTGGLGFIGSHVARRLVRLGAEVGVIDALVPGCGGNPFNLADVRERVRVRIADVREPAAIGEAVAGQDFVFNLVGQVSHVDSMTDPESDLENNARAHLALLEACRRGRPGVKIVLASTRQIYGRPRRLPVDESHPCEPVDVNGIHKWAAEQYHRVYAQTHGIQSAILRLTNTYGPGQLVKHARQGFIGWFIRRAVEGEPIDVMGDGEQLRDLNHVDDVVDALLLAAASPVASGRVYNLGASPPISLRALAELLVKVAGRGSWRLVPFPDERRRIDVGSVYADYSAIRRDLGWEPRVPLRDGLEATLRFYERNLARYLD
jgi:nucleoside-diphosphate-sugar epimerase